MKTLPEGIFFRKAVSGSFMTYLLCFPLPSVSFCLCASSSSPQHCEESQLKWTCGNAHTERFGRLQGQPNSRRIYRQQFQRQKKWQVTWTPCWINFLFSGLHIHLHSQWCFLSTQDRRLFVFWLHFSTRKTHWSPYKALSNQIVYLEAECWMTAVCLLIYFAANRGTQCSMQVRTRGSFMAL